MSDQDAVQGSTEQANQSFVSQNTRSRMQVQRQAMSPAMRQDLADHTPTLDPALPPGKSPRTRVKQTAAKSTWMRQQLQKYRTTQNQTGGRTARMYLVERAQLLEQRRQRSKTRQVEQPGTDSASDYQSIPADPYEYQPITNAQDIRILRIDPGMPGDRLSCELYQTGIHSHVEYHALSYAWGDKTTTTAVICGGRRLVITSSLHGALDRIRHHAHPMHIWADAACINQQDEVERGHQVRLMRHIYKRATSVLIWLGPDDYQQAPAVFESATKIFVKDMAHVPPSDDAIWEDFAALFSRTWFWRLWCLQEIVLASSAEIMWGPESISWECLGFAAAWIRTVGYQIMRNSPMQGVHNAYLMYALSIAGEKHDPVSFLYLLTLTRQFDVSDPRDRVYALLGISTTDADPENGHLYLDPDYTKTKSEVYTTLARKLLLSSPHGLRTLSAIQHGPELDASLPSWVPQWDRLYTQTLTQAGRSLKNHTASASLPPCPPPHFTGAILTLSVRECDSVARTSDILPDTDADLEHLIPHLYRSLAAPHTSYPSPVSAFATTLTANKDWYGMLVADPAAHLADYTAFWRRCPDTDTAGGDTDTPADGADTLSGCANAPTGDADAFLAAAAAACRGRRFLVTREGRMGLGPPCVRVGDVVGVVGGGEVPVVFRAAEGGRWRVVGEAYVEGVMGGEVSGEVGVWEVV